MNSEQGACQYQQGCYAFYANTAWESTRDIIPYCENSAEGKSWLKGYYDAAKASVWPDVGGLMRGGFGI